MDAISARKHNIEAIVRILGGPSGFSKHVDKEWPAARISKWIINGPSAKNIGHSLARRLEIALNIPIGVLDQAREWFWEPATASVEFVTKPTNAPQVHEPRAGYESDELVRIINALPPAKRDALLVFLRTLV